MDFLKERSDKDFLIATLGKTRVNFIQLLYHLISQLCTGCLTLFSSKMCATFNCSVLKRFHRFLEFIFPISSSGSFIVHSEQRSFWGSQNLPAYRLVGTGALCYVWLTDVFSLTSEGSSKLNLNPTNGDTLSHSHSLLCVTSLVHLTVEPLAFEQMGVWSQVEYRVDLMNREGWNWKELANIVRRKLNDRPRGCNALLTHLEGMRVIENRIWGWLYPYFRWVSLGSAPRIYLQE